MSALGSFFLALAADTYSVRLFAAIFLVICTSVQLLIEEIRRLLIALLKQTTNFGNGTSLAVRISRGALLPAAVGKPVSRGLRL